MKEGFLSASAALAAFSESFVESRRALVFGSSLSAAPRLLIERGARMVQVCDPNPARVEEAAERLAAPGLAFTTFSEETLQARDGSFDFVLVENLAAFDARAVVARAKRLLTPRGVALFATPNRDSPAPLLPPPEPSAAPLDYYALYDLVKAEFEQVRMLGQAPFVGYAVVDFAPDGPPEPSIDSEFVPRGSEEPEIFLALASRHRLSAPSYVVVQLPMHRVLSRAAASPETAPLPVAPRTQRLPPPDLEAKLARQEAWIVELEGRAETADARADAAEDRVEALEAELAAARSETRPSALDPRVLEEAQRRTAELEAARRRATELEAALAGHEATRRRAAELEASLAGHEATRRRATELEAALAGHEATRRRATELEAAVAEQGALQKRLAELQANLVERDEKLAERDAMLAERDALLAKRDAAIADRDQSIKERDARLAELALTADPDSEDDLGKLERQLAERGEAIRVLERDVAEAERIGRELLGELQRGGGLGRGDSQALADLRARLAKSEADGVALAWSLALATTRPAESQKGTA
jgi:SAM-dependent methyltransferase